MLIQNSHTDAQRRRSRFNVSGVLVLNDPPARIHRFADQVNDSEVLELADKHTLVGAVREVLDHEVPPLGQRRHHRGVLPQLLPLRARILGVRLHVPLVRHVCLRYFVCATHCQYPHLGRERRRLHLVHREGPLAPHHLQPGAYTRPLFGST